MPIYKLEPIDLDDRDWEASTHKGSVTLRAKDPTAAISLAKVSFGIAAARKFPQEILANPWNKHMVSCAEIFDSEYPIEGNEEILEPEG
ncbi:MAG: hypothetical protein IH995_07360 [Proteobacteria bacterium]|nr:hypothetical protein [Pseudomonadota bacterium]